MLTRIISTLLCLLTITTGAFAGDTQSWSNLRDLSPGKRIEIVRGGGKTVSGSFVSWSADSLTLRDKTQEISVARPDVLRVRERRGSAATWIGAGIGAGAGAGIGYGAGQSLTNQSGGDFASLTPAVSAAGAVIGAAAGAIVGHFIGSRHSTIYRSK
jgi:hypothetical protein